MVSAGDASVEVPTAQFHIYQPPASLRGWPDDHDTEAALRHLGLLDFARLQLPDGIPRHDLVSDLVASYHRENCRGYAYLWGVRVNVDRKSFLSAAALQATADHKGLPPRRSTRSTRSSSTVTGAAMQFMEMWILPQFQGRDALPSNVSAAMREVKTELAHTVDWGELIWDLVQNEILELPKRDDKNSYFGLHLLRLIWVKHPEVFGMKDRVERLAWVHLDKILPQVLDNVTERIRVEFTRPRKARIFFQAQQPQVVNNLSKPVGSGNEAASVVEAQQQSMVVQSSPLAIVLNDDASVGRRDSMEAALVEPGQADAHKHGVKHQFQRFFQAQQPQVVNNLSNLVGSGDEAASVVEAQEQSMVVQSSPMAIVLNDDASVGRRDSIEAGLVEPGQADAHKHGVKQQFQQGNQQKLTRNRNKCSVPSGSTISIANSSGDIIGIESQVKHLNHVKQQFQQGNQQKWTRPRSKRRLRSVLSGSTISSANSSRDIIGIESEVKRARLENQPTKELLEAEMFIQAINVLNETLSTENSVHIVQ